MIFRQSIRPALFFVTPLLTLFALTGCSHSTGTLILQPLDSKKSFSQKFTQTYAAHNDDGSFEFVLIADERTGRSRKSKSPEAPLRQLVHIRVPWLPMRGNVAETIVSNAAIDWYIVPVGTALSSDLLLYSGGAYALADTNEKFTTLTIRASTLKPSRVQGNLSDPLGPFHLTGSLTAKNDPSKLQSALSETRRQLPTR